MKASRIGIFRPWSAPPGEIDLPELSSHLGRNLQYTVSGRAAIYRLIQALGPRRQVLVPTYVCKTILEPIRSLGMTPIFYDVDPRDLNPSLDSFQELAVQSKEAIALVPSLYGFPADLEGFETVCRRLQIPMIDDGAQSFGATLSGRFVSTFGEGGLFSFSPGKATAGHHGALYWSSRELSVKERAHPIAHRLRYLDFYWNRVRVYDGSAWMGFPISKIVRLIDKVRGDRTYTDRLEDWEKQSILQIAKAVLERHSQTRRELIESLARRLDHQQGFRFLQGVRGVSSPFKIVTLAPSREDAGRLRTFLTERSIFTLPGYSPLSLDLPNIRLIDGRVLEIPLEEDYDRRIYLETALQEFFGRD